MRSLPSFCTAFALSALGALGTLGTLGAALATAACSSDDPPADPGSSSGTSGTATSSGDAGKKADGSTAGDDDDTAPPDPEGRKPTDPLRVFVTSATFTGNLDGTSGADTKCQAAAEAAAIKPKGKWVAWISTPVDGSTAADRVIKPGGASLKYQLLDGTELAPNAAALGQKIETAITLDETKKKTTGHAWTGTKPDGSGAATACLAWTHDESTHQGGAGDVTSKDDTWTAIDKAPSCDAKNHLYCFEIP